MKNYLSLLLVTFALFCSANMGMADQASRPNIVIFLVDDLGSSDVGFAGGKQIPTPSIDALAHDGTILDQFYVMHVCSPTRAALMTGRYPIRYGLQTGVIRPNWAYGLSLDERLLSNALHDTGYATAVLGKWHLGMFTKDYVPTRRGFDFQYGNYCGAIDSFTKMREKGYDWHRNDEVCLDEGYTTEQLTTEAIKWIESTERQKPLFLYVPYNAVHTPLQAPEKYYESFGDLKGQRRNYAAMLTAVDESVGKIRETLDRVRGSENNLYFFSTDNGGPSPGTVTRNGIFRAGKGTLYEGGVRSCAFVSWKGHIPAKSHETEPLHIVDIFPTFVALAGAKVEQPLPLDGRDFSSLLLGKREIWMEQLENKPRPILINAETHRGALRLGDWKLVIQVGDGKERPAAEDSNNDATATPENDLSHKTTRDKTGGEKYELYQIASDPAEITDVADREKTKLSELLEHYRRFQAAAVPALSTEQKRLLPTPSVWGEWETP
jgi:arylsulfatase A-like enzyme